MQSKSVWSSVWLSKSKFLISGYVELVDHIIIPKFSRNRNLSRNISTRRNPLNQRFRLGDFHSSRNNIKKFDSYTHIRQSFREFLGLVPRGYASEKSECIAPFNGGDFGRG